MFFRNGSHYHQAESWTRATRQQPWTSLIETAWMMNGIAPEENKFNQMRKRKLAPTVNRFMTISAVLPTTQAQK